MLPNFSVGSSDHIPVHAEAGLCFVILMIFHRGGHIFVSGLENIWLQSNPLDPIVSIQVRTYSSRKPWCLQFHNSEL